ncbi:MAG: head-tail adaptor protein [Clostridia bacterium]|nr:head-tail adaptor protein [Clostridia bacterium]
MKQFKSWCATGELNTRVQVKAFTETTATSGEKAKSWTNVFGEGVYRRCRWINSHGKDVYTAYHEELREPATVLMRHSPLVTHLCRLYVDGDDLPYEIVSPDNIRRKGVWLELTVQRVAVGAGD